MQEKHRGLFGLGEKNETYTKYFKGQSYLNILGNLNGLGLANVTFEPKCRNNWHTHHAKEGGGHILICIDGEGWYQEEGKKPQKLNPGDIVFIQSNVKHWHGATKNSWFSHIVIEIPGKNTSNEWC